MFVATRIRPLLDFDHCDSSVPFLLEYYRINKAMTHGAVCEALGNNVTPTDIKNYESGRAIPSQKIFYELANLLEPRTESPSSERKNSKQRD